MQLESSSLSDSSPYLGSVESRLKVTQSTLDEVGINKIGEDFLAYIYVKSQRQAREGTLV